MVSGEVSGNNGYDLHSTMFIFISSNCSLSIIERARFTFHYVYIYIFVGFCTEINKQKFTFHYVYIYICKSRRQWQHNLQIYIPLCLYLYFVKPFWNYVYRSIYIPLCLYLYLVKPFRNDFYRNIYIPLCLYLYHLHIVCGIRRIVNLHSTMFIFIL